MSRTEVQQDLDQLTSVINVLPGPLVLDFEKTGDGIKKAKFRNGPALEGLKNLSLSRKQQLAFWAFCGYLEPNSGTITFWPNGKIDVSYVEQSRRTVEASYDQDWIPQGKEIGEWEIYE